MVTDVVGVGEIIDCGVRPGVTDGDFSEGGSVGVIGFCVIKAVLVMGVLVGVGDGTGVVVGVSLFEHSFEDDDSCIFPQLDGTPRAFTVHV